MEWLWRVPLLRLTRPNLRSLAVVLGVLFLAVGAHELRSRGGPRAVDIVLIGPYGGLALPMLAWALVAALLDKDSLAALARPWVRVGGNFWKTLLSQGVLACWVAGSAGAVVAALCVVAAHTTGAPPFWSDLRASAYAGLVGGAAYGGLLVLGSALGARGRGRAMVLVVDLVLGKMVPGPGYILPRAHVRSLLGGEPCGGFSSRTSGLLLLGLALLYVFAGVFKASREPQ